MNRATILSQLPHPKTRKLARLRRNWTPAPKKEPSVGLNRFAAMSDGAEKLRALAKQTRVLSRSVSDRERSNMLRALARLYDDQALQLEHPLS